jgi:hypothetical protein
MFEKSKLGTRLSKGFQDGVDWILDGLVRGLH